LHLLLLTLPGLEGDRHAVLADLGFLEPRAGIDLHPPLAIALLDHRRAVAVLQWKDPVEGLDDGDAGTEGSVHVGELTPDRARANDRERLRRGYRHHRVRGIPDAVVIDLEEG